AKKVLARLQGNLLNTWGIIPELDFVLDWSVHPDCWKNSVLADQIDVVAGGRTIGTVHPEATGDPQDDDYHFPLINGKWQVVSPLDPDKALVKWTNPNSLALLSEFDFAQRTSGEFDFSPLILPKVCRVNLANLQTILSRASVEN